MQLPWHLAGLCTCRTIVVYLLWIGHSLRQFANMLNPRWFTLIHTFTYFMHLHKHMRVFYLCDKFCSAFFKQILLFFSVFPYGGLWLSRSGFEEEWRKTFSSSPQCKGAESAGMGPILPPPLLRSWKTTVPSSHILISTEMCATIDD